MDHESTDPHCHLLKTPCLHQLLQQRNMGMKHHRSNRVNYVEVEDTVYTSLKATDKYFPKTIQTSINKCLRAGTCLSVRSTSMACVPQHTLNSSPPLPSPNVWHRTVEREMSAITTKDRRSKTSQTLIHIVSLSAQKINSSLLDLNKNTHGTFLISCGSHRLQQKLLGRSFCLPSTPLSLSLSHSEKKPA